MFALVYNSVVRDISEKEFDVDKQAIWVLIPEKETVRVGYTYSNGVFTMLTPKLDYDKIRQELTIKTTEVLLGVAEKEELQRLYDEFNSQSRGY
jgi:hypothetical protein